MALTMNVDSRSTTSARAPFLAWAVLAASGMASPVMADVWSWNTGNGDWMTASNWTPGSVPGLISSPYTDVRIGNLPGVQNSTVLLNHPPLLGYLPYDELHISSGMTVDMNGRELGGLFAITTLTDANTQIIVRPSAGLNAYDFATRDLTMWSGTLLNLVDNGSVRASFLNSAGVIFGRGTVHMQGNAPFASLVNNGTITGSGNGGLTIIQEGTSRLDLDGFPAESVEFGQLSIAAPFSVLTFQGDQLNDTFSGRVTMGSGSLLNMNMSNGWTADSTSTFNVASSIAGAAAQIDGGHFTFGGDLNIGGSQGHLRVLANATMTNTADVFLGTDDRLEFDGATTVQGGVYALSDGASIDFDGATTVEGGVFNLSNGASVDFDGATEMGGGTFNMVGDLAIQGVASFNDETQWSGATTINGFGRQNGDASVGTIATINANVFDMDGSGATSWSINHRLEVNTQAIETGSQIFDGTMNINGGIAGRLTMNLEDPGASWTMNGEMNLAGLGALTITRVAGSRMIVAGDLNMASGIAQITSDTAFQGANVSIVSGGNLRTFGNTTVNAATNFAGAGVLQNGVGGGMLLNSGVSLGQVGLTNSGMLRIGESGSGLAAVDRFTSTAEAAWGVDIGGYLAGTKHDLLLVTGGTTMLDGQLLVSLLTGFAPQIGDEFTILSSLGGVSGAFSNDPTSFANGLTYDWTVIYNPNTVVLRLDIIVPTPGSLALLGLGGLLAVRRRRV